jgi:DHA1 family bicyclomycin/chloramphenicol resistance-like MFS transporter
MKTAKQEFASPPFRFIALVAMLTALMAMSIDTMLPAQGLMTNELGASAGDEPLIMMLFFAGNMFGIPVFGPMSDSLGRKPSIFAGLVIYVIGTMMCFYAWSYSILLLGRFIQGFGAGSPRIVSMAMVRDGAKGAAMAKTMSFVMSVFMLVPIFAPSIGQLVMLYATWHYIFLGLAVMAVIAGVWMGFGQDETLAPENRRPFSVSKLWDAAREVVSNRVCLGYTLATGVVFGLFTTYLSVCRRIYVDQYDMGKLFPIIFGSLAICIAAAMILNGNLVQKLGMRKLSYIAMFGYTGVWVAILALSFVFAGQPPLFLLLPLFGFWFFTAGFTFGNFNAMAMEPMGHIAGMAAAVSGVISQGLGILLGLIATRAYDGALTNLSVYFVAYALIAFGFMMWAEQGRAQKAKA